MFEDIARRSILAVVWTVLVLRSPAMVRDSRQRFLWLVLAVFAGGSIVIQPWFGSLVNAATGVTRFNDLVQGIWGVLNAAVMLEFVVHLALDKRKAQRKRVVRISWAVATVAAMVLCFALTPSAERFTPAGTVSAFAGYALLAGIYMISVAGSAAWLMWRRLPSVTGAALYAGLLMVTVGNALQVPFLVIRTVQRLTPEAPPALLIAAFLLNTTRFIMVPLGCVIAAVEPPRKAVLHWYRRVRLHTLWRRLRDATNELALTPQTSRTRDLLTIDDTWERLHRRVVEIYDSAFYLYDAWAWPELLRAAKQRAEQAARHEQRRIMAVACWIEVTRRAALSGAPKLHRELERGLLPELQAAHSTTRAQLRYLVQLDRAMRSRQVQAFAREMIQRHQHLSTPQ